MADSSLFSQPLSSVSEAELLGLVFPVYEAGGVDRSFVSLGVGDDTAWVRTSDGGALVTTDTMVRGCDWLDEWSSPYEVGAKCAAQNLADIAAMGGVTRALLVTLVADPATTVGWAVESARGLADAAAAAGAVVVGGDLSSAPAGVVTLSVTAFGDAQGRSPVLRSGARAGDVVAVAGSLGCSGAGLDVLGRQGRGGVVCERTSECVQMHVCPKPPLEQGPVAARVGATSMIDVSDGLVIDAGRVASASGVEVALSGELLEPFVERLVPVVGQQRAVECVLGGGEEHSLLATFSDGAVVPPGWRVVGEVLPVSPLARGRVTVDGQCSDVVTWDHFAR
ncbi:thiamine-phosphate kinase [Dermatophilus congolensis]|uniref:thiamine-phosphate kinase n=1 Tax=Dermatophilus congolensis TaxID=1863 RepID=UPI00312C82B8